MKASSYTKQKQLVVVVFLLQIFFLPLIILVQNSLFSFELIDFVEHKFNAFSYLRKECKGCPLD